MYNDAFTPFDDIQCEDGIDIDIDERDEALEDLANDPDFIDGCDHLSEDVEDLFNEEGGLTADAFALLAGMDEKGEFSS
tara:strand:- start:406 stop:642 length:237 start_codon:yes stop_codon:yes gene_type:complete